MTDPLADRIAQAQQVLRDLNFDTERCNERSALVLLALLGLRPDAGWESARSPMLRTVEIMDWLREHYSKDYKPNTRETIRRQTLHQFVDAGLVVLNPDHPTRAINSPKNCYQIEPAALRVLRRQQETDYRDQLKAYLVKRPGLVARYARERERDMLPVTMLDGTLVELTPGGQNVLLKQMVEEFPRWTPAGLALHRPTLGTQASAWAQCPSARL